ncbi:MAG: hypothetical protein AAB582_03135 [Patescibacteria group bacterium]
MQAAKKLFVGYNNDQIAVQALRILHERGYQAFPLEVGVAIPDGSVLVFSSAGQFASKFIATIPEQFERRGITPPTTVTSAGGLLAIRKTCNGAPYGKRAENLAVALENYVGHARPKKVRPKINRRELSRQRRHEERASL